VIGSEEVVDGPVGQEKCGTDWKQSG